MILNNRIQWDGSHLGTFDKTIIVDEWFNDKIKYNTLAINNGIIHCQMKRTNDILPCIIDNLKPLFNLNQRGLHRITIANYNYLLYYVSIQNMQVAYDIKLKDVINEDKYKLEMQRVWLFCDLLTLKHTQEKNIYLRSGLNGQSYLINTNEKCLDFEQSLCQEVLSEQICIKWFDKVNLTEVVKSMLVVEITDYHDLIYEAIKGYSKEYYWLGTLILKRLNAYF